MKTKPLNNNVLIEVQRDFDGVSRSDDNESMKYGKVIDISLAPYHITASSAFEFGEGSAESVGEMAQKILGKTVRWEEFAEGGQTFEEDGKTYALIPWWRLIGVSDDQN